MFHLPDYFYDLNLTSVIIRLVLAVIFGGIIGLERGASGHPAGFRTHILVCVGAALAMLTNQYICDFFEGVHDPARLGAQVITGVGFLGVGTILVTGGHKIRGLTTAAGLWASACLGLALGIGFYEGAVVAAIVIFVSLSFLPKVEYALIKKSKSLELYIEIRSMKDLKEFMLYLSEHHVQVIDKTISKTPPVIDGSIPIVMVIKTSKNTDHTQIIKSLSDLDIVCLIEEL